MNRIFGMTICNKKTAAHRKLPMLVLLFQVLTRELTVDPIGSLPPQLKIKLKLFLYGLYLNGETVSPYLLFPHAIVMVGCVVAVVK